MEKLMYTYALIKALCDYGEDYLDCFWPFTLMVFPDGSFVDSEYIRRALDKEFSLKVPIHPLSMILGRAKKKGYIEQSEKKYRLLEEGARYLGKLKTISETKRQMNSFVEDLQQYLKKYEISLSQEELHNMLLGFCRKHSMPLLHFINPAVAHNQLDIPKVEGYESLLIDYMREVERQKPEHFETLKNIVLGSVISTILYARNPSDIAQMAAKKFKRCQVFLDANYTFSVLNMHPPELVLASRELFSLLKKHNFEINIFSFTIDEMCKVLGSYSSEAHRYPSGFGIGSLFATIKEKGWSRVDVVQFVANIDRTLEGEGIRIVQVPEINLMSYEPEDRKIRLSIEEYKREQERFYQNHDLAAIERIAKIRGRKVRNIEDAKALFLTSDGPLSRFNNIGQGHEKGQTIPEVILDRLITTILWLKDPDIEVALNSIVAVYSNSLFINRKVWDKFFTVMLSLKQEKKIKDQDIEALFFRNYIMDVLKDIGENQTDMITEEYVLRELMETAKSRDRELKENIEGMKKELGEKTKELESAKGFLSSLNEAGEALRKSIDSQPRIEDFVHEIEIGLREKAEKEAKQEARIRSILATALVMGAAYGLYYAFNLLNMPDFAPILIALVSGPAGGLFLIWTKFRKWEEKRLSKLKKNEKLKEARLDEGGVQAIIKKISPINEQE